MPIFFHIAAKGAIVSSVISEVSEPNVTEIVHNVEKFIQSNLLKSELRLQSLSEWQRDKVDWSVKNADFSTLIGCHGNVP